ncbi:MAG: hypothetical protein HMLIMOIP_002501 [Candidatus Nitrosomirales archaeon]|jgi:hypothetical protein
MYCTSLKYTLRTDNGSERPSTKINCIIKIIGSKAIVDGGTNWKASRKIENTTNSSNIIIEAVIHELIAGISLGK